MDANDSHSYDLDDVLFAKFAELDQKVAMLREEMDSIAMLLERRKRMRDSSQSFPSHIGHDIENPSQWVRLDDTWEAATPIQENSPPTLSFGCEADEMSSGRLYDADLPNEHDQQATSCCRVGSVLSSRMIFHPYRRTTAAMTKRDGSISSRVPTTKRISLPAFFMPGFQGATEEVSTYLISSIIFHNYSFLTFLLISTHGMVF
nr:unnamed protein product [Haemonchus contortus]